MKNHSSARAQRRRGGAASFRTPSRFIANNAEAAKRFKQPLLVKGKKIG